MRHFNYLIFILIFMLLGALPPGPATAANQPDAPLPREKVPEPLKPWIDWALHGHPDKNACPLIYNNVSQSICRWPSALRLNFKASFAEFSQTWQVFADGTWLFLPGSKQFWPQSLTVNGAAKAVVARSGQPAVFIEQPGRYAVSGRFDYQHLPERIRLPDHTGMVDLRINEEKVAFPRIDQKGRLWLRQRETATAEKRPEDRLRVEVFRLVKDTIPLRLVTRLEMSVSGKHRNVRVGRADTQNFIPMELDSPLPARIENDGTLLMQVRPGRWTVEITARHTGPVHRLSPAKAGRFGDPEEVWSFEARRQLRLVDVQGPPQIDPQQTSLPEKWRQHPAFLMKPDTEMKLVEKKRGNPVPAPDQLQLDRTLWLDFDGGGFSVKDRITGKMTTGWRLAAGPPLNLGRVTVDGRERLITRLAGSDRAGVEMRRGRVNLTAESRIDTAGRLPITGWNRDFKSMKGRLNLPPGWSLLHAAGIDNIRGTWLRQWSLLDLFLVLIIALATAKLRGWPWGLAALVTLVLITHEPGSPRWIWLHLLAAMALLRVVPQGKVRSLIGGYRLACLGVLIVISLPFMVFQVRNGFYPQLEQHRQITDSGRRHAAADRVTAQKKARPVREQAAEAEMRQRPAKAGNLTLSSSRLQKQKVQVQRYDTNANIQTGPGIPGWHWRQIAFSWNGPVGKNEKMRFVLLSPGGSLALALLRTVLLASLIFGLSGIGNLKNEGRSLIRFFGKTAVLAVMAGLFSVPAARAADSFPPASLLESLSHKLTIKKTPDCAPLCASSPRLRLGVDKQNLTLHMEVHSLHEQVAVPLPASVKQWTPQSVILDDRPADSLYWDSGKDQLWLAVPAGVHRIHMSGALRRRNKFHLPLPLKPHRVEVSAEGWQVEGVDENGAADDQLQFERLGGEAIEADKLETIEPERLPPFLTVHRTFHLGLNWKIETTVRRLTPTGSAVAATVPLIDGESVTTEIPVSDGRVKISMDPGQRTVRWVSSLDRTDRLTLKAPETLKWTEIWRLDAGAVWHVNISGIPVIQHQDAGGRWLPEWRPWPGEKVVLDISRPEGVEGQTFTVESSRMTAKPGKHMTNAELLLTVTSSRGSQHTIKLPEKADLQSVAIDGKTQPIRQAKRAVTLPLTPGRQKIKLEWRQQKKMNWQWQTPRVDLNIPGVDARINVHLPHNRWVLFCGGPYVGPAVLFWSLVLVIALLSAGLGRIAFVPLRPYQWLLLGLGLTQASLLIALPVAAWFLALGYRRQIADKLSGAAFNGLQVLLVALTAAAAASLLYGIKHGLLGYPDMQIAGNGSGNYLLKWYQDITGQHLPTGRIISLPLWVYRVLILGWALWIAFSFINWLRWAWDCWSTGGWWHPVNLRRTK